MDSETKLLNRPVETDTTVLSADIVKFKEFVALIEHWKWDGITASSVIYLKEDARNLEQEALFKSLFEQMNIPKDRQLTYKESGEFVFINFNFKIND